MKMALHMMRRARTVMHLLARDVMARMTGMRKVCQRDRRALIGKRLLTVSLFAVNISADVISYNWTT
ncbi:MULTISPECIES: hypothetical protein [Nitrosomonas]|uniref:Uncharacterized protein n=1 Tax=Nitrosomonas communis TaxID=44574 RepID=A0A0F7KE18_9PROT|nr:MULTISPECIES: hypothetical protein [Nitrosomonas]AKH37062.1 hypothetical protein AAW31_03360 [Nitrosomonas communis]TYP86993.1 hypothetical protein BCL69_102824 [Nitrosomonas communis]UVS62220.1 hypothetical protein NX761_03540 [Nitrosomonas sp. PLL12]